MDDSSSSYTAPPATASSPSPDPDDAAAVTVQARILSLLRHLFTGVIGIGSYFFAHAWIPAAAVDPLNAAGNNAGNAILALLAIVAARVGLTLLGKYLPGVHSALLKFLSGAPGGSPLWLVVTAAAGGLLLSSCATGTNPFGGLTGTLTVANGKPVIGFSIPIKDSTGKIVGSASISGADGGKPDIDVTFGVPTAPPPEQPVAPVVVTPSGK